MKSVRYADKPYLIKSHSKETATETTKSPGNNTGALPSLFDYFHALK